MALITKKEQTTDGPAVSVIVASHNKMDELDSINKELQQVMNTSGYTYEVILVDDGSDDGSWKEMVRIAGMYPNTKLVKLRSAFGESSALDAGFSVASGEMIVYFTTRVRVNPKDLLNFIIKMNEGFDIIVGMRSPRRDSKLNQIVSRLFNAMTNKMTKLKLHDINSGVLAARRSVLEHVPFYGTLNAFLPVLAHRQGYKITEVTIEQLPGHFELSLYPKNYIKRMLDFISVIFISKYSKKPLHFLGFFGVVFTLIGVIINIYLFFYRILGFGGIAGRPLLLLGVLLFIIGIQMISIGLLGEMIIYTHANEIEEYNIEEIIEKGAHEADNSDTLF